MTIRHVANDPVRLTGDVAEARNRRKEPSFVDVGRRDARPVRCGVLGDGPAYA